MGTKRLLLIPGDFLAWRFDEGYARFMARMKREMGKGNRRLAIYSLLARAECWLAFVVGAWLGQREPVPSRATPSG